MFEVNWCLTGKDPDTKPFYFQDWIDAVGFLCIELRWQRTEIEDPERKAQIIDAIVKINAERMNASQKDLQYVVGNISYWLLSAQPTLSSKLFGA